MSLKYRNEAKFLTECYVNLTLIVPLQIKYDATQSQWKMLHHHSHILAPEATRGHYVDVYVRES